jgi:hypothetical protein
MVLFGVLSKRENAIKVWTLRIIIPNEREIFKEYFTTMRLCCLGNFIKEKSIYPRDFVILQKAISQK